MNDQEGHILDRLKETAGRPATPPPSFRNRATRVGSVYTISYTKAIVAVFDFDREKAGGLPRSMFLLAAKEAGDESFILLRVQREARLPTSAASDETRQKGIERSGNRSPWAGELDEWVRDQISLHALECTVLGTFIVGDDGSYRYAEDIDNYYSVHELMAWKPDAVTLELIVNHRHRSNDILSDQLSRPIGRTRFAAAESDMAVRADFRLNATDMLKRRTVYLGMSRSGKSNGLKVVAESVYRLREGDPTHRVGQLIFDLNGEYAQDNPQDGKGLHRIHEVVRRDRDGVVGLDRDAEVTTYGLFRPEWDQSRKLMKMNFYGDELPSPSARWDESQVHRALHQLIAGREIIKAIMKGESVRYTSAFRDADLALPPNITSDDNRGQRIRYARAILAYQTALYQAGFEPPSWKPSVAHLFGKGLIDALRSDRNDKSNHAPEYRSAAGILKNATTNRGQGQVTWHQLGIIFTALDRFIRDTSGAFKSFDQEYTSRKGGSGESWADSRLSSVIRIFESHNGPRAFQRAREQHDANSSVDFVDDVVADLRKGKLVIIDQSSGEPQQNRNAAERVMWKIFRSQQDLFRDSSRSASHAEGSDAMKDHILVYVEEAHNLLPSANKADTLQTVWARTAKEGSKMNIGMVLATQAPSSIMPEILSETDNWILSYLNSEQERKVISGYMDFADFLDQMGKVSEPGFVRIRTLSQGYTVPIQLAKFWIGAADVSQADPKS